MRWLIRVGLERRGPFEEHEAVTLLRENPAAYVRREGGGAWLAAKDSPFAPYLTAPTCRSAQPNAAQVDGQRTRNFISPLFERRRSVAIASGGLMIGIAVVLQAAWVLRSGREGARERERQVEQAERQRQADLEKQRAELLATLPNRISVWRKTLAEATRLSTQPDRGLVDAFDLSKRTADQIDKASAVFEAAPPGLVAVRDEARQLRTALDVKKIAEYVRRATDSVRTKDVLSADESLARALKILNGLKQQGDATPYLPKDFNLDAKHGQVTKLKASLADAVAKEHRREEEDAVWQKMKAEQAAQRDGRGATQGGIRIPTDPTATYAVLARGGSSTLPTLTTRRDGSSGTSYSKRLFDCSSRTFAYLGEGDTLQEAERSGSADEVSALVEGSISDFWWHYACGK